MPQVKARKFGESAEDIDRKGEARVARVVLQAERRARRAMEERRKREYDKLEKEAIAMRAEVHGPMTKDLHRLADEYVEGLSGDSAAAWERVDRHIDRMVAAIDAFNQKYRQRDALYF